MLGSPAEMAIQSEQELTEPVLKQYPLASVQSVSRIPAGLIHRTFLVKTASEKFILQRLHPDMSSDEILADYRAVTEHLAALDFPSPKLVLASGERAAVDTSEGRYRLITFLEGVSIETVTDARMAAEAARMLGAFHAAVAEFRYAFTGGRPLHDSPKHYDLFRIAMDKHARHPLMAEAGDLADRIETCLPKHFLPDPLPSRVVHGDPKISNILFHPETRTTAGIVDLDSCGRHTVLVDIGDAVRSWCRNGPEDQAAPFLADRFSGVCEGYRRSGAALSDVEKSLIVRSCRLITLELASRFLRDVFEDRYFGWDETRFPSRPAHNLARARGCIVLYDSMAAQAETMEEIVREAWS